jgi:hypothetical protein
MRRFDFEEEEPEDYENFLNSESQEYLITPEEYKSILEQEKSLYDAKFGDTNKKLKYRILVESLRLLRSSFFWKFYSLNTKLIQIEKVFNKLKQLLEVEEK